MPDTEGYGYASRVSLSELSEGIVLLAAEGCRVAVREGFRAESGAAHGFSVLTGAAAPRMDQVARAVGIPPNATVAFLKQVHGDRVVMRSAVRSMSPTIAALPDPHSSPVELEADDLSLPTEVPPADGHLTDDPHVALAIQTADCVPVLVADPRTGRIGAAHAGWKGTASGIAGVLARRMIAAGSRAEDLVALFGPAIRAGCYEVGEEVIQAFEESFPAEAGFLAPAGRAGHAQLDLIAANRTVLLRAGVSPDRIHDTGLCTACRPDLFPSWRRDGPGAGRMWSVIGTPANPR